MYKQRREPLESRKSTVMCFIVSILIGMTQKPSTVHVSGQVGGTTCYMVNYTDKSGENRSIPPLCCNNRHLCADAGLQATLIYPLYGLLPKFNNTTLCCLYFFLYLYVVLTDSLHYARTCSTYLSF